MSLFVGFALLAAQAAQPGDPVVQMTGPGGTSSTLPLEIAKEDARLLQANDLIAKGQPAVALALAEQVIAEHESKFKPSSRLVHYSARSMVEAVLYGGLAATQKKSSIVLGGDWALAYFLKGFALIDLNRSDEAIKWLDKAASLAPMNAHILAERAEWYKSRRDWKRAFAEFESARTASAFTEDDWKDAEEGRAIRGMAFVRIEQGKLDQAERLLNEALKLNPADKRAREELELIASLRKR